MAADTFAADAKGLHLYNAWTLASLSVSAYREQERWSSDLTALGFELTHIFNGDVTQAFIASNATADVLTFRGTEFDDPRDVIADAQVRLVPGPWGRAHRGVTLALDEVWSDVEAKARASLAAGRKLWVTGHSLGAGMALLSAARLTHAGNALAGVHAFGAPRVGDEAFAAQLQAQLGGRLFRYVNDQDVVTRLPPEDMGYRHVGRLIYFDGSGAMLDAEPELSRKEAIRDRLERAKQGPPQGFSDHLVTCYEALTRRHSAP